MSGRDLPDRRRWTGQPARELAFLERRGLFFCRGAAGFAPQLIVMLGCARNTPTVTSTNSSRRSPRLIPRPVRQQPRPSRTPTNTSTATRTATSIPGGALVTFLPIADAYVRDSSPTSNYGNATSLRADASPVDRSYLRFNVQGLGSPVTRATLRLRHQRLEPGLPGAQRERQLLGRADDQLQQLTGGRSCAWLLGSVRCQHLDKRRTTSFITGNGSFNLALTTTSSTAMSFSSRQGTNPPQLVIETQNGPVATSTFTPTSTSTATGREPKL